MGLEKTSVALLLTAGLLTAGAMALTGCSGSSGSAAADQAVVSNADGGGICLKADAVDHTEISNDSAILFVMKDRTVWRNNLQFPCPSLQFEGGFDYATDSSEICGNAQSIRVLRSGTLCELGQFVPASAPGGAGGAAPARSNP